ncbi:4-alpha-glucanotransferase [Marivita sp. XM-24bin2]|jgi:4-alpha-glucanotransferase|uniref:4-alpha-glucanotransferase n=1 Tax=unclassified Marivita TaxID=2632480 RepID=UPI000D7A8F27|nr:4-alpha-glucanotransferase [Marivita sp. XM-24bin2]MCR9108228.1 4-alpha-glucanotransferase [Paracoccaceae bacterium]PWL37135.1 MAG: 4-alpha-glucanotransferase [Marivita sp. XM-24bin2]
MSSADDNLRALAEAQGVYLDFFDLHGVRHEASPDTLRALLRALGTDADSPALVSEALAARSAQGGPEEIIALAGDPIQAPVAHACDWALMDEAGSVLAEGRASGAIDLPRLGVGYYTLHLSGAFESQSFVMVRPHRAPDLATQSRADRGWGTTGALYGLRSDTNGGLGNYTDLGAVAATFGHAGAQFLGVNPLHALGWAMDEIISPYSPSHRGMFNIDHIAVEGGLGATPEADLIDYAGFRERHREALDAQFTTRDTTAFAAWCKTCSEETRQFAEFEAISEIHGHDFRTWPAALQTPGAAARNAAGKRAEFHLWLQYLADTQINAAQQAATASGMSLGLYLDLAVGPRPDGAEVWMNADTIAKGVTIGAPPDHLSPEGQSWALAAHAPGPLARARYAPLRSMLRRLMVKCGVLRIDHALGLLRSYWLPDDGSPGGYITQPLDSLLAVITIEAHRAGCLVVGEDLGLVPDGFREAMNDAGLYSYAVWQFEANHLGEILPPDTLPPYSLACFGTHDTPTLNGFWHGTDIEWWQRVGWLSSGDRAARHSQRAKQRASLRDVCAIPSTAPIGEIADTIHRGLAQSPAALVSVQLDDVFGALEAQNLPGTITEHPNWRRRLSVPVEAMEQSAALLHISKVMREARGAPQHHDDTDHPKEVPA